MTTFAYIHCKPDGTPFYVGKGVRTWDKIFTARNAYHKKVVAKYGQKNILIGKIDCSSNDTALQLEVGLIKCLRRMGAPLTNLTDGGEGSVGWKCPDNVKVAVSIANKNRTFSAEQRYRLGASFRGKKRPEHSILLKERGNWAREKNPFFNSGEHQVGEKNHMARKVLGVKDGAPKEWTTLKSCADDLGVSIQAISQAIRKKQRSKGWKLEHLT